MGGTSLNFALTRRWRLWPRSRVGSSRRGRSPPYWTNASPILLARSWGTHRHEDFKAWPSHPPPAAARTTRW